MRPRHSDTDLLALAREGSAPAFASLLHRHRDLIQRGALRAERPERVAETAMVAGMRDLRRGRVDDDDLRGWLTGLVETQVAREPGTPGVERLLPGDWFDRAWARAERCWPRGRRRPSVPRWVWMLTWGALLALGSAGATYLIVTAEAGVEVISDLVAVPIEDPDVLVVPGPVVDPEPEEAPELFGDVELGELPTYDLTGEGDRPGLAPPSIGPRRPERDDPGTDDGDAIPPAEDAAGQDR